MKRVLVTAIGSFSADIVIKNMKKLGFDVIGCDIYARSWVADSANVSAFYQAPYATDPERYLAFLKKICVEERIAFIMPLTDVEIDVLNLNRQWFDENGVCLCMSSTDTIETCRDKKKLYDFIAQKNMGIRQIPTMLAAEVSAPCFDYPLVCKIRNGRSSQGLRYVHNEREWKAFVDSAALKDYMIQPRIDGSVVTVDVVRSPLTGQTVAVARRELLRTLNGAGTSVHVYRDACLEQQCVALANALGIIGCVNLEWIRDADRNYHFLECNPRFSGGVEFSCMAGYDFVGNHIRCFTNEPLDEFSFGRNLFIARKYEEFITSVE